jgi:O-antigen ligase
MVAPGTVRERVFGAAMPWEATRAELGGLFYASAGVMMASLLLGGGTRDGFLSDAILELLAIPAFLLAIASLGDLPWSRADVRRRASWALLFCLAIASLPLVQLVPLPPQVWTRLRGREAVTAIFDIIGGARPWLPISVAPNATAVSALSLLPPFTIFLATLQLGYRERRWISQLAVAIGVVSVFLGLTQLAEGPASSLRFFAVTNIDEAVGFFANRNHFAALLYSLLLFAVAWTTDVIVAAGSWNDLKRLEARVVVPLTASVMVCVVLLVGEVMARSRAGFGLTLVALAGGVALAVVGRRASTVVTPRKLALAATALVVFVVLQFGLYRMLGRLAVDPLEDARLAFAHNTLKAALAFMPLGSGVGTFVPVYAMFETPADALPYVYANHAHNDYLEIWLETGVMGIALLGLFIVWIGLAGVRQWRQPPAGAGELDWSLIRAASVIIALIMAHSFVDYPLRTGAMMAIFAFCCALLIEPLRLPQRERRGSENEPRALERGPSAAQRDRHRDADAAIKEPAVAKASAAAAARRQPPALPSARPTAAPAAPPARRGGRWGEDIEWPDAWRKPENQGGSDKP